MEKTICYVGGCGRLGLSLAVWTAHKGFNVLCADVSKAAVAMVNSGESPISEPGVQELVTKYHGTRLSATTDVVGAVLHSGLSFVVVPTPSQEDGVFSLKYILAACDDIGTALRQKDDYHVVVIVSTVMPNDTSSSICPRLEYSSGKKAGPDFGLVYSPEFVRQGSIIHDFANPDQILVGQLDARSGDVVCLHYAQIVENLAPQHRMSLTSAEITKLGLNATVVMKLTQANELAWLCHMSESADARDVLKAIGSDRRVGLKYFNPGPPPGGPCFPRDCRALVCAAQKVGVRATIAEAVSSPDPQFQNIVGLARALCPRGGTVGILGLTYKLGVDITKESAGLELCSRLRAKGFGVVAHDPRVTSLSLRDCIWDSDLLILATPWPEFLALQEMDLGGKVILDLWGLLDEERLNCERYVRFGKGG